MTVADRRPFFAPGAVPYWMTTGEDVPARNPELPLQGDVEADVVIVGGGFTGLWTAIHLTEADPAIRVELLEQEVIGFGASGRNGGFCEASLTHGLANGLRHFPGEIDLLEAEGRRNLAEIVEFTRAHGIDCELEPTGTLRVADCEHQVPEFQEAVETAARHGLQLRYLDEAAVQAEVHSPRWKAGIEAPPSENVILNPAKLAWGLKRVALERGVRIREGTRVERLERVAGGAAGTGGRNGAVGGRNGGVLARTAGGSVRADRAVVATSAYSTWRRGLGWWFVPVYDYVLVTDPLTAEQMDSVGWSKRQGMSDVNNRFHYFRLTADNRILWGGYDAIYHQGSAVGPQFDLRSQTFDALEVHFREAFPQLGDVGFPYRWGGAIDVTSRFTMEVGTSMGGRVVHAIGYTGLGVGASRWAAARVRDHILDPGAELLKLRFLRSRPWPFPPEPLRSAAVWVMQRELRRADERHGRRGLILKALDRLGIGFDS